MRSEIRYFWQFQLSTDTVTYRSEVLDGRLELIDGFRTRSCVKLSGMRDLRDSSPILGRH